MKKDALILNAIEVFYFVFFASIVCSFRAVTSITLIILILLQLWYGYHTKPGLAINKIFYLLLLLPSIYFLLQAGSLFYTGNIQEGLRHIQLKTGLVAYPLLALGSAILLPAFRTSILRSFVIVIIAAMSFCLIAASYRSLFLGEEGVFFYHELVRPFNQHAVHVSVMVFIATVLILEPCDAGAPLISTSLRLPMLFFLTGIIMLLASKLVIVCTVAVLFGYFFLYLSRCKNKWRSLWLPGAMLIMLVVLLFSTSSIRSRFADMAKGPPGLAVQEQFNPGIYFNGVQFRLLQWKLVPHILSTQAAWWKGVTPGDAKTLLDREYQERNMYTGEPGKGTGLLGYNTHNQLLESLLQSGIPGATIFILMLIAFLAGAWKFGHRAGLLTTAMVVLYSFVESIFETQYGLFLFCFFPVFLQVQGSFVRLRTTIS